ncbi:ATP-binding protein [Pseudofulvibacter geojedonensis]|uniref:Oxygen sensor histidine kinase NreB n=1 Tax=Pseudofulvibacter geojedonensis TaxID=1123758 RepID=A0ABW3I4T2_9FLAO
MNSKNLRQLTKVFLLDLFEVKTNNLKCLPKYIAIFILVVYCSCNKKDVVFSKNLQIESSIEAAKNKKNSIEKRRKYLYEAYRLINDIGNDSIKNSKLLDVAFQAKKVKDSLFFRKVNKEAFVMSKELNDELGLAKSYWSYGSFFSNYEVYDSAYYFYKKAYDKYKRLGNNRYEGKMLYNMAFIQYKIKDYLGCESNVFRTIPSYELSNEVKGVYKCYNLLGVMYGNSYDYNNSKKYHKKALSVLEKLDNNSAYKAATLNNIGLIYKEQNNYKQALSYFNKALEMKDLYKDNIRLYASLKTNIAYSRLLSNDTLIVEKELLESLKIRDSINHVLGIISSKLSLAEYNYKFKDTVQALILAKEANRLAKKIAHPGDVLASLQFLSEIDKKNSYKYLNEYVDVEKEVSKQENFLKNKFARIRFETDEYIEEANRLSAQQTIILISSIALILVLSLLYFVRLQRSKNKALQLEAAQQQANQEVYQLLLKQQEILDEGKMKERHRISEELHDGVLGKIFGTRMGLGFLDIQADEFTQNQHQKYIDELQEIEKEIRVISHELKNELIDKANFIQIIEQLLHEQSQVGGFTFSIEASEELHWSHISNEIKINCYRVLQEAVQNINKYAQAKQVQVILKNKNTNLLLQVIDDGMGFPTEKKYSGIGLKNIESRIKKLNGFFKIDSVVNKGTKLYIEIPLLKVN